MTVFPVVATPLNVRTEHVCGQRLCQLSYCKTLVADPAFVVLPEVPDLACNFCAGEGTWITHSDDIDHGDEHVELTCESCGGSGVSPVYAATWQHRVPYVGGGFSDWTDHPPMRAIAIDGRERRQVVEWRATKPTVLPVIGDDFSAERMARTVENRLCPEDAVPRIAQRWGQWLMWTDPDKHSIGERIDAEPWAADLRPGQFVLRLDGWEHLQQPHTEMTCRYCHGRPLYEVSSKTGENLDRLDCHCDNEGVLPLSVPDGVLSWMELV